MKFQWNTNDKISQDETIFTIREKGKIIYKEDRPLLLISSTSWT